MLSLSLLTDMLLSQKAKMLKKKAPERKDIVEVPRCFKQQRKKKQQMIEGTKKKKQDQD